MGCYVGSSGWSAREDSHWPLPARYPTAAPGHHAEAADAPVELAAFLLLPCSGLMKELTHRVSCPVARATVLPSGRPCLHGLPGVASLSCSLSNVSCGPRKHFDRETRNAQLLDSWLCSLCRVWQWQPTALYLQSPRPVSIPSRSPWSEQTAAGGSCMERLWECTFESVGACIAVSESSPAGCITLSC